MAKSNAKFAPVAHADNGTTGVINQAPKGATMAELKATLSDYYAAPSLAATLAQSFDASRKFEFAAQALTRLALNAAHSGTIPSELTNVVSTLQESIKVSKGVAKAELLRIVGATLACGEVIIASKNAHKGADIAAFEQFAIECEGEFLGYLTPIKTVKVAKPTATKSVVEKIIASIQAATLSSDDVKALQAALANVTPTEPAPL